MAQTKMVIKYVEESVRADWQTLKQISEHFTEAEIVEQVNRYQDAQKHAIAYRRRSQAKAKVMAERLAELELRMAEVEAAEDPEDGPA